MARILVVDDNESVRDSTENLLRVLGHTVTVAFDAHEALGFLVAEEPYDLIISDYNMSGLNGLEFRDAVLEDPRYRRTPFIIASGNRSVGTICEKVGVTFFLKGSIDFIEVVKK